MTGTYNADLLTALLWLVGLLGTALITASVYIARQVVSNQRQVLDSQKQQEKTMAAGFAAVKESIDTEVRALRELFHSIDKRVMELEFRAKIDRHT